MAHPFVVENSRSRQRLEGLVARLTDDDLARTTPFGWTVAALLAHLAYWDRRVLVLLKRWKDKGFDESPVDADAVNEALRPLCHAVEPRVALDLSLDSAQAADAEIETLSEELVARIASSSTHFRLNRGLHRNDHLDQIEQLLG